MGLVGLRAPACIEPAARSAREDRIVLLDSLAHHARHSVFQFRHVAITSPSRIGFVLPNTRAQIPAELGLLGGSSASSVDSRARRLLPGWHRWISAHLL